MTSSFTSSTSSRQARLSFLTKNACFVFKISRSDDELCDVSVTITVVTSSQFCDESCDVSVSVTVE